MIKDFFSYDGKLFTFLNKSGELILVNIVFVLFCIPVVTAGSSLTSFYYAMIKSVRRERGNPVKEFMNSMKRTFGRGILLTLVCIVWIALLLFARSCERQQAGETAVTTLLLIYDVLIIVTAAVLVYIFPVFSRFEMKLTGILKLSFVMSIRFLPTTILGAGGSALVAWLVFYKLPMACILVVPGVWCYLMTYPMEKALTHYIPQAGDGEEKWYDMERNKRADNVRGKEVKDETH